MGIWNDDDVREAKRRKVGEKGLQPGTCAVCGCSEQEPCIEKRTGLACSWTNDSKTLCTACEAAHNSRKRKGAFTRRIG